MKKNLLLLSLILYACIGFSFSPLSEQQAFSTSIVIDSPNQLTLHWSIAPGYHLYRDRMTLDTYQSPSTQLSPVHWPVTTDTVPDINGTPLAVYTHSFSIPVTFQSTSSQFILMVHYQGCASAGFCYPPTTDYFSIQREGPYHITLSPSPIAQSITQQVASATSTRPAFLDAKALLNKDHGWWFLIGFFLFGCLIALTPCVLPMIPILASILVRDHNSQLWPKALAYVLGMSVTYAIIGVIFGFLGASIQSMLQQPWLIITMAVLFAAMALALFDCYQLNLPQGLTNKVQHWQTPTKRHPWLGTFLMGAIATLILSPCVTPPLVGALLYISHTGHALKGGVALFMMGLGMGVPLLIIGGLSQRYLPKAGPWMNAIKAGLGVLMLAVAILVLSRLLSGWQTQILWVLLFVGAGLASIYYLQQAFWRCLFGFVMITYGVWLAVQCAFLPTIGHLPIARWPKTISQAMPARTKIQTSVQLTQALNGAANDQLVMVVFSADWCLSCQVMETSVFTAQPVQAGLIGVVQLDIDLTKDTPQLQALQRRLHVVAPPTILFFKNGQEIPGSRLVGEQTTRSLLAAINMLK